MRPHRPRPRSPQPVGQVGGQEGVDLSEVGHERPLAAAQQRQPEPQQDPSRQQVQQRGVLVVPRAGPRHEHHVDVAEVRDPGHLRGEFSEVEEPPPILGGLPQHVPLRDRDSRAWPCQARVYEFGEGHVDRRLRNRRAHDRLIEVRGRDVVQPRKLVGVGLVLGQKDIAAALLQGILAPIKGRVGGRRCGRIGRQGRSAGVHTSFTTPAARSVPSAGARPVLAAHRARMDRHRPMIGNALADAPHRSQRPRQSRSKYEVLQQMGVARGHCARPIGARTVVGSGCATGECARPRSPADHPNWVRPCSVIATVAF